MENTIFGEKSINEEVLIFKYDGKKFANHEIDISELISELKGIEALIEEVVKYYKQKYDLSDSDVKFDVLVRIEDGSIKEIIRLTKRNAATLTLISTFVMPFIEGAFNYYLNQRQTESQEVLEILENSKKVRRSFENILTPITGDDNAVSIYNGDVVYNINCMQKKDIVKEIKKHEEVLAKEEMIREEDLIGVISVSKYDDPNPFSFRVNETTKDIPLYFEGLEFNLEDRQEFLGKELLIKADVTYRGDARKTVTVKEYKEVAKLFDE